MISSKAIVVAWMVALMPLSVSAQELYTVLTPGGNNPEEIAGDDLYRHTLSAPGARCNDDSPAVMYVRPARGSAPQIDKWVIVLEAGGSCFPPDGSATGFGAKCANRWQGIGGVPDVVQKMSTDWLPAGAPDGTLDVFRAIEGLGILEQGDEPFKQRSVFADWNQVYLNYCSSDFWTGQSSVLSLTDPTSGATYDIRFRGHMILEAVVAALQAGGLRPDDYDDRQEAHYEMRDLDEATHVLLAGDSAGGHGVAMNTDWLATQLPGANVRAVVGAALKPRVTYLDPLDAAGNPIIQSAFEARWQFVVPLINGFTDTSCVAALPAVDRWQCLAPAELLVSHITTPTFVRQDLADHLVSSPYIAAGLTMDVFATAVQQTMDDLPAPMGHWGPWCGDHEALYSYDGFFGTHLDGRSYHEGILDWIKFDNVHDYDDVIVHRTVCP